MKQTLTAHNLALKAAAEKKRIKIRRLRKMGKTWQEIADSIGVSRQRAQQLGADK